MITLNPITEFTPKPILDFSLRINLAGIPERLSRWWNKRGCAKLTYACSRAAMLVLAVWAQAFLLVRWGFHVPLLSCVVIINAVSQPSFASLWVAVIGGVFRDVIWMNPLGTSSCSFLLIVAVLLMLSSSCKSDAWGFACAVGVTTALLVEGIDLSAAIIQAPVDVHNGTIVREIASRAAMQSSLLMLASEVRYRCLPERFQSTEEDPIHERP